MSQRVEQILARARQLSGESAFAPAKREDQPTIPAEVALAAVAADARATRRGVLVFVAIALVVAAFSLLLPYFGVDAQNATRTVYSPATVCQAYWLWVQINVLPLFDHSLANQADLLRATFAAAHGDGVYTLVTQRALVTFMIVICGIALALSGLLFQTAFRNPLAAPSSLGVSDGVSLGCIIYSMLGFGSIQQAPVTYLLLVYGLGALSVALIMAASRWMAGPRKRYNVLDMLLIGTIFCQLMGSASGFIQNFIMSDTAWFNFYDIQQATDALSSPLICKVALVLFTVTFIPALLTRFALNMIAFSDDDGKMAGLNAGALRICALVLGSAMQLVALATVGQVAMLSLAVPFLTRFALPARFPVQFVGNAALGSTVLLVCVAIQHFAVVDVVTMPLGTIVSIFIIPFFVWMVAFGKGSWN